MQINDRRVRYPQHNDDDDHILRDGQRLRVPLTLMDALDPMQRAVARESLRITDGEGGTVGLHRPGFRIADADAPLRARDAAYSDYERELTTAWRGNRSRQREGGTGMLDCEENAEDVVRDAARHTKSAHRRDYHTPEQMMRDHQNKMADIYDKLDHELSETWRRS